MIRLSRGVIFLELTAEKAADRSVSSSIAISVAAIDILISNNSSSENLFAVQTISR